MRQLERAHVGGLHDEGIVVTDDGFAAGASTMAQLEDIYPGAKRRVGLTSWSLVLSSTWRCGAVLFSCVLVYDSQENRQQGTHHRRIAESSFIRTM